MDEPTGRPEPRTPRLVALLALAYLALGAVGLTLAIPPGYASPVFPAAGVALAAALRFGPRALPGVWLGSLLLNLGHAALGGTLGRAAAVAAVIIACGATLQAAAGRALVTRLQPEAWRELESEGAALAFLLLGGALASLVSASVSVAGLAAAGIVAPGELGFTWWTWYAGDALGALLLAPLSLCFLQRGSRLWRERRRRLVVPVVAAIAIATVVFQGAARWEIEALTEELQVSGDGLVRSLRDRLIAHREVLAGVRSFLEANPAAGFGEFEAFTRATLRDHEDVSALSYDDLVAGSRREALERALDRATPGGFRITERDAGGRLVPAGRRAEYAVVRYIVPLAENRLAVGFDILSEPVRRAAVDLARVGGGFTLTAPVELVQARRPGLGLLELLPVYGPKAEGPAARPEGFAVAVVTIREMVEIATRGQLPAGLAFELRDAGDPGEPVSLHRSAAWGDASPASRHGSRWSTTFLAGQRTWVLTVATTEAHRQARRPWVAWAVALAGLLTATLLQVLLLGMTGRAAEVQRQKDELEAHQPRLRMAELVFERTGSPILVADPGGHVVTFNPAFAALSGWSVEELRGQHLSVLRTARHPPELYQDLWRGLETRRRWHGEMWVRRKEGEFLAEMDIRAVGDDAGVPARYVAFLVDATERRATEERAAVAGRLKAMGTLVTGVAHEVNSPLAAMLADLGQAVAELGELEEQLRGGAPVEPARLAGRLRELGEGLSDAREGGQRISRIVQDLGQLGQADPRRARLRLADAVRGELAWLREQLPGHVALELEDAGAPDVEASPGHLAQLLGNLVRNAAQAIPEGRPGHVTVRVATGAEGTATLEVRDDGVGMKPEVARRCFDPFFTTRPPGQGTGLGLAICHAIVTSHRGTLAVESGPGKGSVFRVELPAAPGPAGSA